MGLDFLDKLHGIAFPKKRGSGNAALDAMDKDDLSMDSADLGGFESAVTDMESSGENTELLLDEVTNPRSNQAFQSPVFQEQMGPLGPGMFQPDTTIQDKLAQEQFLNRDVIESVTKPSRAKSFLGDQAERLGVGEEDQASWIANMMDYAQKVRGIESDNNPNASAGTTSAKGVYQFTDASVITGQNRMRNMGFEEDYITGIDSNPHKWDDDQADAMFFANMFAQKGSDEYMRNIGAGEDVGKEAYYKYHHTAPDDATRTRATDFFGY